MHLGILLGICEEIRIETEGQEGSDAHLYGRDSYELRLRTDSI